MVRSTPAGNGLRCADRRGRRSLAYLSAEQVEEDAMVVEWVASGDKQVQDGPDRVDVGAMIER